MSDIFSNSLRLDGLKCPFSTVEKEVLIHTYDGRWILEREITFKYSDSDDRKALDPNDHYTTAVVHSELSEESLDEWLQRNGYGNDRSRALLNRAREIIRKHEELGVSERSG